jgi:hypothetical protein
MFIHWKGFGWVAPAATFGCSLVANLITNAVTGDGTYWKEHGWPFASALIVAGVICARVSAVIYRRDPHGSHSFFFIPLRWWTLLTPLGAILLFTDWAPG